MIERTALIWPRPKLKHRLRSCLQATRLRWKRCSKRLHLRRT